MSEANSPELNRAYQLIENDQHGAAQQILTDYLAENPDNADGWWLYVHAVDNVDDARFGLENYLRLKPSANNATVLLRELNASQDSGDTSVPVPAVEIRDPDFLSDFDTRDTESVDDFGDDFFDDEGEFEAEPAGANDNRRRLLLVAGVAIAAVVLFVVASVILSGLNNQSSQPVANESTATPTDDAGDFVVEPTLPQAETQPPVDEEVFTPFYSALADQGVIDDSAGIETTTQGSTFLISVCSGTSNRELRDASLIVIPTIAQSSSTLQNQVMFVGARFVDCDTDTTVRILVVAIDDAVAFTNGTLERADFIQRWQVSQ